MDFDEAKTPPSIHGNLDPSSGQYARTHAHMHARTHARTRAHSPTRYEMTALGHDKVGRPEIENRRVYRHVHRHLCRNAYRHACWHWYVCMYGTVWDRAVSGSNASENPAGCGVSYLLGPCGVQTFLKPVGRFQFSSKTGGFRPVMLVHWLGWIWDPCMPTRQFPIQRAAVLRSKYAVAGTMRWNNNPTAWRLRHPELGSIKSQSGSEPSPITSQVR